MLLAFLMELSQKQNSPDFVLKDVNFVVVACAFDGIEGNSPATGALVDRTSLERISTHILATGATDVTQYLKDHLERNDSYNVFKHLDDAFITGYTGTNVNDMVLILLESK
jgi:glycerate-2-kinase